MKKKYHTSASHEYLRNMIIHYTYAGDPVLLAVGRVYTRGRESFFMKANVDTGTII